MGYLIELDDIGVSNLLEDLDLPRDALYVLLVLDLVFLQDFHSNLKCNELYSEYLLTSEGVGRELDLAESAFAQ